MTANELLMILAVATSISPAVIAAEIIAILDKMEAELTPGKLAHT